MDFYQELQKLATDVLTKYAQGSVQLVRSSEGPPDPTKPWEPGSTTVSKIDLAATVTGVKAYQMTGTEIEASDLVVTCAVVDKKGKIFVPVETDVIFIDGTSHVIKKIEAKPAAGTPVSYTIFVAG